ncbi:MAG: hypothetical protein KAS32_03665, partial [Candidatus Peribacteraceae bacterium]|nr:hypothetical protein [Candidatus Peribacteraceae bacterium]
SNWEKIYLRVYGSASSKKLRIGQAPKSDMGNHGATKTKRIGFVTTKTYNILMGKILDEKQRLIWISEGIEKITIGADPEFAIIDPKTGEAVYGDTFFRPYGEKYNQIGSDGPCGEIRPSPANNVEDLVKNIENLLKNKTQRIIDYDWIGGASFSHPNMSRRYPMGGHLHFGLPNIPGAGKNPKMILQKRVARILDELVALPMVRIDTPLPEHRRNTEGYGKFEDVKTSNVKFEWRVPSGLWLVHKDLTRAVIGSAKAVVEECWKQYADRDYDEDFMLNTNSDENILTSFDCLNTEKVRDTINSAKASSVDTDLIHSIHGKLRQMSTYCMYRDEINMFIKLCCSDNMPLPTNKLDLKRSWLANKPL